ncbi:MAG: amino acid adenylation domain-containing protein, partial [Candidatus Aminicenantes bacterium]|nr:amino acid adenylation domain-containing protein [Candidatus Aminicenantes bacterium]
MLIKKFEEQVKKNPGKIAIKTGRMSFSYERLNREANRVAHLITKRWPRDRKNEAVGLFFEHSPHMIAAILGTLKAGKVYVPLSTDYPENRLSYMLSNSESSLIITNSEHEEMVKNLSEKTGIVVLVIDKEAEAVSEQDPVREIFADKLAYIMYTSGSTGRPKGVKQTHKNIHYYTGNWTRIFSITAVDNMTLFSSFCHDGSVQDLFSALLNGATLFPVNIRDREEAFELADFLIKEKITIWHSVPSLYSYFINTLTGMEQFENLRFLLLGGEAVREHEVDMYKKYFSHSVLANVYGQTESSVDSIRLIRQDDDFDEPLIGEPLDETKIFVIDEEGGEVDTLQTGEIVIACPYISPGYWKNDAASEKAFSEDEELGRLYCTGDQGRLLLDGGIVFMGRKDQQVKIRGFRIELAEIETRLLAHEDIKEAVVLLKGDGPDDKLLTAYYVADRVIPSTLLREFLARELPDYMVPTYYLRLQRFPLTQSGKIDRNALPEPELNPDEEYTAPGDKLEQELVEIWSGVLGEEEEKIGINTSFFALGGHSLRATALVSIIHKYMNVRVPLAELFRRPTVKDMAKFISETEKEQHVSIKKVEDKPYYSLSSAQKRLFILEQQGNLNKTYNMPGAVQIEGPVNIDTLKWTFQSIINRHESFRTSFSWEKGEPVQRVYDARKIEFKIEHYEAGNRQEAEGIIDQIIRPFDLAQAPLLRVALIRLREQEHILFFDTHHIVSDGISVDILIHEFVGFYTGEKFQPLRIQYKDFSEWENRFFDTHFIKKQENFWLEYLNGELPELRMPLDFRRPEKQTFVGKELSFTIPVEITEKLNILARKKNITLNILILSIHFLLVAKYSNREDIIVGSLVSGRNHPDMENIIGMFGNFLPIRNNLDPGKTFSEFLDISGRQILTAYDNQDYPFEKIIDLLCYDIDLSRNPVFDTMLIFHNEMDRSIRLEIDDLKFSSYPLEKKAAKLDFKLDIYLGSQGELPCILEFNTGLFKEETMRRFIDHFIVLIEKVIKEPEKRIADFEIFNEAEKLELAEKRELGAPESKKVVRLAVSATFTSEPVENYILWWG